MPQKLIETLLQQLPRYAEEEGDFYSVPRHDLIVAIAKHHAVELSVAENTVVLCERLLETLSVLNVEHLVKGEWYFVSFPAQLMATSVLTALSDHDSRFFAPNFWNTQGISNDKKDNQRDVLSFIEHARYDNHASSQAKPIRYCYVAWSIIKLDGKILFFQREDTQKRFDKSAGDYGLIGGRANQTDLSLNDKSVLLKALQSPYSELIINALSETLKRELREEAGLVFEKHYTFKLWRKLKPYQQIQGAAPNHALTEYYLEVFKIDLTLEGYLFLQQKVIVDDRLVWFSIEDMARGESTDGKIPYIRTLYDDYANDRQALASELEALPDSFVSGYKFQPTKYGVTLSIDCSKPVLAGVLGKEKPLLGLTLTERQLSVLLGLAAHLRGFEFSSVKESILFHPNGWVQVAEQSEIQSELVDLTELLKGSDLIIENYRDIVFRLSISPEIVFFDENLFSFSIHTHDLKSVQSKIPVRISRKAFITVIGVVQEKLESFKLPIEFVNKLSKLHSNTYQADNDYALKIEDAYKKGLHKEPNFIALGLRNLIRREDGNIRFVLKFITE